jgi:hypothetical protein
MNRPAEQPEPERIRLYRFMKAKWAITSIETRELRVGRLAELNDPFEFVPGITGLRDDAPKDYVREQLAKTQPDLNSTLGLLSFAASCREPTLWSHYAESHKGIALCFDILRNSKVLDPVSYPDPSKRPVYHPGNPDESAFVEFVKKTITTKALGWKPECEWREFVHFACSDCRFENGNYFVPLTDDARELAEVILGCRCLFDKNYIEQTLKQNGFENVRVVRAKLSIDTFEVEAG